MKNRIFIKLFAVIIIMVSCDDTLDTRLSTSIEANQVVTDLESLDLAVNGTYGILGDADLFNRTITLVPDLMSDNLYLDAFNNTGRYIPFDDFTIQDNNGNVSSLYTDITRVIAQSTIIIREADNAEFPDSELEDANQYKGEARFLRALAYFKMQQFFAQPYNFTSDASHLGVPIPDAEALGGNEILEPSRSTTAEVYSLIVNDLEEAISLMREEEGVFRADVWAAEALLARVHLNMGDYELAEERASKVIDQSGATLVSNDSYVASWSLDFTEESIFSLANIDIDNSGFNSIGYFYNGYDDAFPTPDFLNQFEDDDVRNGLYVQQFGDNGDEFSILKYPDIENQADNIPILRLSEMYLIKAEAHARQSEEEDAREALDAIRNRADDDAEDSDESGDDLIDKIILERRKELAFEGFRLFDLTRIDRDFQKYRQDLPAISIEAQSNITILPIPLAELNRNPNMEPNPGY